VENLIRRHLVPKVEEGLRTSRIVNIVGARQCGKSTLVEHQIPIAEYITMDAANVRNVIQTDAYAYLRVTADRHKDSGLPVVLDEIQRVPEVTLALKRIVDEDKRKGQFILTGSADVFGLTGAGDSLAGRVHTLTLRPLSVAEIRETGPCLLLDALEAEPKGLVSVLPTAPRYSRADAIDLMLRGGFPEMRWLDDRLRMARYSNYVDSIIVKDVPIVAAVRKPDLLRRLIDQLAARTAQELNITRLCNALGARKETIGGWLEILERVCMVHRLPSWASSGVKQGVHWPKLHFLDTGCVTALRNETAENFDINADPTALGAIFESFVHDELEKAASLTRSRWKLSHWRSERAEIDIVAEGPGRRLALFETKAASMVSQADFNAIDWFLTAGPGKSYAARSVGFVVYLGHELLTMGPGRVCLPLSMFWSFS
jgi:uncharacterized protein